LRYLLGIAAQRLALHLRREAQRSGVGWNAVLARALPTKMTLCHLEPKRIWR
jgi:hypothetical protein